MFNFLKPKIETCKTCLFYYRTTTYDDWTSGLCRRHAPVFNQYKTSYDFPTRNNYPVVVSDKFCGDYFKKNKRE